MNDSCTLIFNVPVLFVVSLISTCMVYLLHTLSLG